MIVAFEGELGIGDEIRPDLTDLLTKYEQALVKAKDVPLSNQTKLDLCVRQGLLTALIKQKKIARAAINEELWKQHGFEGIKTLWPERFGRAWEKIKEYVNDGAYKLA